MSFDFNPKDQNLNDLPNPYRVENLFLFASFLVLAAGGVATLLAATAFFKSRHNAAGTLGILLSAGLFAVATKFLIQTLSQLRVFLGRKFPLGLAGEVPPSTEGVGEHSQRLVDTLRRQSIEFPEPQGPLCGALYSVIKPLATAPLPIQDAAVRHVHSVVTMTAIFLSMAVSWFIFHGTPHEGVMSWVFMPLTGLSLITPFIRGGFGFDTEARVDSMMLWKMVGLIFLSIAAPTLVPRFIPAYPIPPMWAAPLLVLIGSVGASCLFLKALFSQMDSVPDTTVSCEQTTATMNCHPAQLWPKLSRDFQDAWTNGIPNRCYANVPPGKVSIGDRDRFNGYVLEETHPTLSRNMGFGSVREAMHEKFSRYLIALGTWGLMLAAGTAGYAAYTVRDFAVMPGMEISRSFMTVVSLGVSAVLSLRIGHLLWSRMYFKSRMYYVDLEGTWQTGKVKVGNNFTGKLQTEAVVTRVEDATLRIWASDIESVSFGVRGQRFLISMSPLDGVVRNMADRLKSFALEQSSITTPTSHRDLQKVRQLVDMDQAINQIGKGSRKGKRLQHQQLMGRDNTCVSCRQQ